MKKIQADKVVMIPDIHQDIGFASTILEQEDDADVFVFLGDYFDTFRTPDNINIYSVEKTCEWLNETKERLGDRAVWLFGNHDIPYFARYRHNNIPRKNDGYFCSGFTRSKANTICRKLNPEFFTGMELCCKVGNYFLSHAGFHYDHFLPYMSEEDNIERLYNKWEEDKSTFYRDLFHWIWEVGPARKGYDDISSPIWLDWNHEFVPIENIKQIVGHTTSYEGVRSRDGNYCIDGMQQVYAVLEHKNVLDFRYPFDKKEP